MRISDWSSDVCSSDLAAQGVRGARSRRGCTPDRTQPLRRGACEPDESGRVRPLHDRTARLDSGESARAPAHPWFGATFSCASRSEEHTSELQSLMRISYAVFCLKKKNSRKRITSQKHTSENTKQPHA